MALQALPSPDPLDDTTPLRLADAAVGTGYSHATLRRWARLGHLRVFEWSGRDGFPYLTTRAWAEAAAAGHPSLGRPRRTPLPGR